MILQNYATGTEGSNVEMNYFKVKYLLLLAEDKVRELLCHVRNCRPHRTLRKMDNCNGMRNRP